MFLAIQISGSDDISIVNAKAILDLEEFNLTPEEMQKFKIIFVKLNKQLADSLYEQYPTSSVISEIRPKSDA
ncbi:hypothetical protein NIES4071_86310 [Calothrix sp. NIES-4071]|nr:hypothetical protein NIES4071_86310 [Calothrix sp. NIES-4071]BAZ62898.1 hypothetical protein NIES4105_86240 [Calothrix sp. NIES-4105]